MRFFYRIKYSWNSKIAPYINITISILLSILSIIILISECTLLVEGGFDNLLYRFYRYILTGSYIQAMIFTLLLLGFLCIATYYGIFSFKLSGFYGLYPYHQTEPANLAFSAHYLVKLTAPLCLNFLMIIHFQGKQDTVFDIVAGEKATLAFVKAFLQWFPCIIIILCASNYANLYSKIMKCLKLDEFTYYDYFDEDRLESGKALLEKEHTVNTRSIELANVVPEKGSDFKYVKEHL